MRDYSVEIIFQSFLQEALVSCSGMGRYVHSLMLSTQHFFCRLEYGFGETLVACDMCEPCKCPSLDSCQKRFLWTYKKVDLAPHPVVGLVLQAGDTEKFRHALGFESLDSFFRVSKQGHVSQP